jgi:hypothetical protein
MLKNKQIDTMTVFFLVFVVLLLLKAWEVINVSWWIVTAPLWGPVALVVGSLLLMLLHVKAGGKFWRDK